MRIVRERGHQCLHSRCCWRLCYQGYADGSGSGCSGSGCSDTGAGMGPVRPRLLAAATSLAAQALALAMTATGMLSFAGHVINYFVKVNEWINE